MRLPEPTEDELRNAWQRSRRPDWPATYEEAMEDDLLSRLVRINAMHPPRGHRKAAAPAQRARTAPPTPGLRAGYFDRKRAASGEREDD